MTSRTDVFNQLVGLIFAQMLSDFPARTDLDQDDLLARIDLNSADGHDLLYGTVRWLRDEGFMSGNGEIPLHDVTLTKQALAILNSVPESIQEKRTFGDRVKAASQDASSEAGKSAISEIVGQIIGAAAKSMI